MPAHAVVAAGALDAAVPAAAAAAALDAPDAPDAAAALAEDPGPLQFAAASAHRKLETRFVSIARTPPEVQNPNSM